MENFNDEDFKELDKTLNKGFFVIMLLVFVVIFLSYWIYGLNQQNSKLEYDLDESELLLNKCNKKSYNRFILAKDLTEICDRFKSSKEAKEKYYFENGIVE